MKRISTNREAFQREDAARRQCGAWRQARLEGPYAEGLEPALESRVKCEAAECYGRIDAFLRMVGNPGKSHEARRRPALMAREMDARVSRASIRVVPPDFRSLCGAKIRRFARISRVKGLKGRAAVHARKAVPEVL